jgi:M6 family metalloprotease-like protein
MTKQAPALSLFDAARRVGFIVAVCVLAVGALPIAGHCVPACPGAAQVKQPDGTQISVVLKGDEHFHWNEDPQGYLITKSPQTNAWVYAVASNGVITPTQLEVGRVDPAALGLSRPTPYQLAPPTQIRPNAIAPGTIGILTARTGTMMNLVVLVSFSDLPVAYTRQQYDDLFNQIGYTTDGAVGSVKDFYHEVSYNALTVQSTVVEAVTLDHGYAYYGANDGSGSDVRPREMVSEALAKLAARGFDFHTVDGDGDGWVDGLDIIHAGGGEEYSGNDTNYIWSHQWQLASPVTYNGINMQNYHTEPARRGWDSSASTQGITRIGVICHETGHFLGLPDLYDTGYDSEGVGNFCLMSGGSWGGDYGNRPVHMSAWCKAFLGWVTPTVISTIGNRSLSQIETTQQIYKLQSVCGSNDYFLIENRQGVGFDQSLPGSSRGILIWHIDDNQTSNNDQTHYHVDLEEASCTQHLASNTNSGDDADYFRSTNATAFTDLTCPNNYCYSGTACPYNISGISATGATMTFDVVLPGCVPPSISANPADRTVRTGTTASFSVTASGTSLTYQWQISTNGGSAFANVTAGTGGTTATYTTAATISTDNGSKYRCIVSGACLPTATSTAATLTVTNATVLLSEGFESAFVNGAPPGWTKEYKTNTVDWVRSAGDHQGGAAAVGSYNALLYYAASSSHETYLVSPPINFTDFASAATLEFYHKQAYWSPDQDTLNIYYKTSSTGPWNLLASHPENVATWTRQTVTLPNLSSAYYIGFLGNAKYGWGVCIDDVLVWQESCGNPATITGQPADRSTCASTTASFSITAVGALHYQWQWQPSGGGAWTNIGTDSNAYSFVATAADNGKSFRCQATNACGTATSNTATLTVRPATSITTQPSNQSVCAGSTATFSLTAGGEGTLSYSWLTQPPAGGSWSSVGGNSNTYVYTATADDNGRKFFCWVTGGCGSVPCNTATLTIKSPTSTTDPSNQTVNAGGTASFSVTGSGDGTLVYQWQTSANGGAVWDNVGSNSGAYSFTAAVADSGRIYRCTVAGGCGTAVSNTAALTVNAPQMSISDAKLLADAQPAGITGRVVTFAGTGFFYIEEDNRASGIRVVKTAHGLAVGDRVNVTGSVSTGPSRERFIAATSAVKNGTGSVAPLFMINRFLGGQDWHYDLATGMGQKGISGANGVNTIGLLVRVQGKVMQGAPGDTETMYVDDGSGTHVAVELPTGVVSPGYGAFVAVTGVSSCADERQQIAGPSSPAYLDVQRRVVLARDMQVVRPAPASNYSGEMIYVPAGSFLMGNSGNGSDATYGAPDELPQHTVHLSGYHIGKHEVTRGEYRAFMDAGGYSNRAYWSSAGWNWKVNNNRIEPDYWTAAEDWGSAFGAPQPFTQTDNRPVVSVTYYEAEAFCNWAGGHLPTEAQWEKAARWTGSHPNLYPWGDTWDAQKCNNFYDSPYPGYQTAPEGSYTSGASPYGCLDMAGNVREWCCDWYTDKYQRDYYTQTPSSGWTDPQGPSGGSNRVLRGGSWGSTDQDTRCASRYSSMPNSTDYGCGFRIAR